MNTRSSTDLLAALYGRQGPVLLTGEHGALLGVACRTCGDRTGTPSPDILAPLALRHRSDCLIPEVERRLVSEGYVVRHQHPENMTTDETPAAYPGHPIRRGMFIP